VGRKTPAKSTGKPSSVERSISVLEEPQAKEDEGIQKERT
jgi:hypothetical protein